MSFTRLWFNSSVKSQPVGDFMGHYIQFQDRDVPILTKTVFFAHCIAFSIVSRQKSVSDDHRYITNLWYLHPCPSVISFQTQ